MERLVRDYRDYNLHLSVIPIHFICAFSITSVRGLCYLVRMFLCVGDNSQNDE